ncbi:hypothetical protein RMSM_05729 [Rhodopirellula maiorica SM1]|uniref:Uncharacterized protein n=1 Tax=Rhodopirellula maiorica SM1 TaxID=1265738 RepID=M5RE60_9BACT|nr:hypothetical protein [Rhodopirellula maiorica]EMI17356.1 hypothetical protein RMSM_05729 [Rhodopirellula maiorica SM1]
MTVSDSRLLLFDDNIRSIGGHFLELATLLMEGASELGYTTRLATHQSFDGFDAVDAKIQIERGFRARRMIHWSLGVDGRSKVRRGIDGANIGGSKWQNAWQNLRDPLSRPDRRPAVMLERWSADFLELLRRWDATGHDTLLINTADDFVMLALARALKQLPADDPLTIHIVFHFAVFDSQTSLSQRQQFGDQVNDAMKQMGPHHIHLHATTASLSKQLGEVGVVANAIPYPTRYRAPRFRNSDSQRYKIVLAGTPRAEKGRSVIPAMLSKIHAPHLASGRYQMSMQMPAKRWKRMIPKSMQATYERTLAAKTSTTEPITDSYFEITSSDMPAEKYHQWLDTADVGLFLYDASRYVARCSGVLLEMFIRGVPVVVPDHCWLADQVRAAGGNGSVGYIYESIDQIPGLLDQMHHQYEAIRWRARHHGMAIAKRHRGTNTLIQMGIRPAGSISYKQAA